MPSIATMMGNEHITGTGTSAPRVVVYGTKAQDIEIHNPHAVAKQLGGNVLAAFYKCFNGADRLRALQHVMDLIHHAERIEDAHNDQSAGYTRDRTVVGFLLAGAVRETAIALNELHGTRITRDQSMQESWGPLNAIRLLFEEEYARNIRNNFAMHLGEQQHYVDGIASGKDQVALLFMNSGKEHGGVFPEAWNALFRAHGLADKMMDAFVGLTKEAHETLPILLINLYRDALELRGVRVEFRPGRRLAEPAADEH